MTNYKYSCGAVTMKGFYILRDMGADFECKEGGFYVACRDDYDQYLARITVQEVPKYLQNHGARRC